MGTAQKQTTEHDISNSINNGIATNIFSMLSTTVEWMLDTSEMDKNYDECKREIARLEKLPKQELAKLGISRDEIPVIVFSNLFDNRPNDN